MMENSGKKMIRVNGTTATGITDSTVYQEVVYRFRTVYYKGNLSIGEKLQKMDDEGNIIEGEDIVLDGLTQSADKKTWTIGATEDVNTRTAVLKVDGNLTIQSGITLTSAYASRKGTKGLIIYVSETFNNLGTVNMDSRGASGAEPLYLFKKKSGAFAYFANGAAGGAGIVKLITIRAKNRFFIFDSLGRRRWWSCFWAEVLQT